MRYSRKKLRYLDKLLSEDLISGMKRYRVIEEMKAFGVTVDDNADLDGDTLRLIFSVMAAHMLKKHEDVFKEEGEFDAFTV